MFIHLWMYGGVNNKLINGFKILRTRLSRRPPKSQKSIGNKRNFPVHAWQKPRSLCNNMHNSQVNYGKLNSTTKLIFPLYIARGDRPSNFLFKKNQLKRKVERLVTYNQCYQPHTRKTNGEPKTEISVTNYLN